MIWKARSLLRPRTPRCKGSVNMASALTRGHLQPEGSRARLRRNCQLSGNWFSIYVVHKRISRGDLYCVGTLNRYSGQTIDRTCEHEWELEPGAGEVPRRHGYQVEQAIVQLRLRRNDRAVAVLTPIGNGDEQRRNLHC